MNRLFGYAYRIRLVAKRLKRWNKATYYALKWSLLGGTLVWIFA